MWLDWTPPIETSVSQPWASASAARYSSLRTLLPPYARPGVAVLALGPDLDLAAEVLGEALEAVDRGGAERERNAWKIGEAHAVSVSPG